MFNATKSRAKSAIWRLCRRRFPMLCYRHLHGYNLNPEVPRTWNEKLLNRSVFGDGKKMSMIADKYLVRDYVKTVLGNKYLPVLYGVFDRVELSDFDQMPSRFVIKTNHGSGRDFVELVHDKSNTDLKALCDKMNKAILIDYGKVSGQRFYSLIEPRVIIEEFLGDGVSPPEDFKFHCFNSGGEIQVFIQVDVGRFVDHRRSVFDENWNLAGIIIDPNLPAIAGFPRPALLTEMIHAAKQLAIDFNYIRVDLYAVGKRIVFGELTLTHGNAMERVVPREMDDHWGDLWVGKSPF